MRLRELAAQVRVARTRLSAPGRLACVITRCPTCFAEAGDSCYWLEGGGDTMTKVTSVHAERATLAAKLIEEAP